MNGQETDLRFLDIIKEKLPQVQWSLITMFLQKIQSLNEVFQ